jgi:hypothetical protein
MRNLARAAGLAALLLSAIALAAAPTAAGGPTSVLLSVPGAGSTASLYYTDPEYDELAGLVGVTEPGGSFESEGPGGHEVGSGVTLTWLIHDVEPWRVDRIYLGARGGPWIATQVSNGDSLWDSPVRWHRPANGKQLAGLLDRLGLSTDASQDPSFDGVAGASVPESRDATAVPPARVDQEPAAAGESIWLSRAAWGLGGLLGGALLTLAWTRRRSAPTDDSSSTFEGSDGIADVLVR